LRYPIIRIELDNILKDLLALTYNYSTATSAHVVLEQVIEIQCMLAKSTDDYGLVVTDPSLLRVANTPNTQFLLQAELRAIHNGLQYKEKTYEKFTYKGYVDKDGKWEGVGIRIWSFLTEYGEGDLNKIHGCGKVEWVIGNSYWGKYKDGEREGYGTWKGANGNRYIG
jgi:hypothetical protein